MTQRDLTTLPVFGREHADCQSCELTAQCDRNLLCHSYRPKKFNGLMVIGEGPGHHEVSMGKPFVGKSGELLRALLTSAGINMDECYVTNATLGKPPAKGEKGLLVEYPRAVPACLSRLEAEIAEVKPRVILTVGAAALGAVTGYDKEVTHQTRFDCPRCDPTTRKVGPVIECNAPVANPADGGETVSRCGHLHFLRVAPGTNDIDPHEVELIKSRGCEKCTAKLKRVKPKMIKCPACQGRKTRPEVEHQFVVEHRLKNVAGAVFVPASNGAPPKPWEIDHTFDTWGVRYFVPTYHPAFLLRDMQFMAKPVQHHMRRAKRLLTDDLDFALKYTVTTDPAVVREFTRTAKGKTPPVFTVDIETEAVGADGTTLDATHIPDVSTIKCIGIGTWAKGCLVIDTRDVDPKNDNDELLNAVQDFLEDVTIPKSYHNGLYDIPVMHRVWWIDPVKLVASYSDDTLGAHALLYPDEPHDLGHVTLDLVDTRAWKPAKKEKGQERHESFEALCEYNARDVMNTDAAREALGVANGKAEVGGRAYRAGLSECYALDSQVRRLAVEMTLAGMPVSKAKWAAMGEEADREVDAAMAHCHKLLLEHTKLDPADFQPHTPKYIGNVLFTRDGFDMPASSFTETNQFSTDAVTLRRLRDAQRETNPAGAEFVDALLDFRGSHKTRSTYLHSDDMQPWDDGRIHPTWKPWGARTGRFSSSPPAQNWPKWLRVAIEASEGRKIVGADFDQLELRIMAALSDDKEMIRRCMEADDKRKLEGDWDLHSFVGTLAFGGLYTNLLLKDPAHDKAASKCACQTCKRKALRDLIKRVVYGLGYGAGDMTVLEAIYSTGDYVGPPITLEMIAHVRKTIFRTFPGLAQYREDIVRKAQEEGEIRSPIYHRRRIFPLDEVAATEILNYPIQCLHPDTLVLTQDGYMPIGAVPTACTASLGQGLFYDAQRLDKVAEQVWEVRLADGSRLKTNADHRLLRLDSDGYDFAWEAVANIQPGDVVAQTLAVPQEFGVTHGTPEDFFWLGYWIGNGSWSKRNAIGFDFGSRLGLVTHDVYAQRWCTWAAQRDFGWQKPQVHPALTSIRSASKGLRAWLLQCGVDPTWRAHTKRVPTAAWRASLVHRREFLRGYLEADGTLAVNPQGVQAALPAVNTPNRALLEDFQLLARTCGINTRIIGPYVADTHGHMAWRLSLPGSLLMHHLDHGTGYVRQRFGGLNLTTGAAVERFLAEGDAQRFATNVQSFEVLRSRLRHGGQTNPHTLARMRQATGLAPDPELYAACEVLSVTPLEEWTPMHTLLVHHPLHRYDSAGFVSKNSGGADIVNERTILVRERLPGIDPSAFIFAQVHDALYVECNAKYADAVAQLLTDTLTYERALVPGAPAMRFTATGVVSSNWKDAA